MDGVGGGDAVANVTGEEGAGAVEEEEVLDAAMVFAAAVKRLRRWGGTYRCDSPRGGVSAA